MLRSVRPLLGEMRGLCLTSTLPGSRSRCLSAVGGPETFDQPQQTDDGTRGPSAVTGGLGLAVVVASGVGLAWYLHSRERRGSSEGGRGLHLPVLELRASADGEGKEDKVPAKVSVRERRYKDFSSVKFNGEPYMTPRDFLESVTLDKPRREF